MGCISQSITGSSYNFHDLYASSLRNNKRITQKAIATASGVTEVTIRNRFKDLKNQIDE
jgi:transcription initiation factor TFIIIB Brf1 subunit/transcription initiation factor TFIIB